MTACNDVEQHLAEAALGLLEGTDRATVLAHVETCDSCREMVDDLARVSDALVLATPSAEPPAGFERRVLQRVGTRRPARKVLIGAAAAAIMLVLVGYAAGRSASGSEHDLRALTMRTPSGQVVGEAYVRGGDPSWVFVAVPDWRADRDYRLRVDYADGQSATVTGDGLWSSLLPNRATVLRLALIDADGRAWCSADV